MPVHICFTVRIVFFYKKNNNVHSGERHFMVIHNLIVSYAHIIYTPTYTHTHTCTYNAHTHTHTHTHTHRCVACLVPLPENYNEVKGQPLYQENYCEKTAHKCQHCHDYVIGPTMVGVAGGGVDYQFFKEEFYASFIVFTCSILFLHTIITECP